MDTQPDAPAVDVVHVDLGQDPQAAAQGRRTARLSLCRWDLPALMDDVVLVVSELIGNALRHGKPPVGLTLRRADRHVHVDVHDDNPTEPPVGHGQPVGDGAESGRGLAIVQALATDVTVEQVPDDGKIVHASFDTAKKTKP